MLDLIQDTQTSFVQNRSDLDNIFTFSEATEWAQHSGQHLAILLLDFQKAYDRVDWFFLEGNSSSKASGHFSFVQDSFNHVLIGGRAGERFGLSASVWRH